jgi:hypothetical protein
MKARAREFEPIYIPITYDYRVPVNQSSRGAKEPRSIGLVLDSTKS